MQTANLIWGLIFSSISIGYFIYGRRLMNLVAVGVVLMLTPRFIER